ncbi:hypothetical protein Nepgr_002624 [Nepenthes gracilis]|uniref:Uncharacterized protein n=1 Tax=Nepenthes gracilis TaxID=150966 RepID=A0AAD3RYJ5_NEPGR|nr:hypothetical protein Nepgr_002624 [Nepenthes gracilis]
MRVICPSALRKGFAVLLLVLGRLSADASFLVDLLLLRTAAYALLSFCLLSGPLPLLEYVGVLLAIHWLVWQLGLQCGNSEWKLHFLLNYILILDDFVELLGYKCDGFVFC